MLDKANGSVLNLKAFSQDTTEGLGLDEIVVTYFELRVMGHFASLSMAFGLIGTSLGVNPGSSLLFLFLVS
jgi:hypothetical protein